MLKEKEKNGLSIDVKRSVDQFIKNTSNNSMYK